MPETRFDIFTNAVEVAQDYRAAMELLIEQNVRLERSLQAVGQAFDLPVSSSAGQAARQQIATAQQVTDALKQQNDVQKLIEIDRRRADAEASRRDGERLASIERNKLAFERLRTTFNNTERAQIELIRGTRIINAAFNDGTISIQDMERAMALLRNKVAEIAEGKRDLNEQVTGLSANARRLANTFSVLAFGPLSGVGARLISLTSAIALAGAKIAGFAVALAILVKSAERAAVATERLDALIKRVDALGISFKAIQEIQFVGDRLGIRDVVAALEIFARRLGDLQGESGEARKAFELLNVEVKDFVRKPSLDALEGIRDRMSQIEDPARRAAVSAALFSRANQDMVRILSLSQGQLDELRDDFQRFGGGVDENVGRIAEKVQDQVANLTLAARRLRDSFIILLGPVLEKILNVGARLFVKLGDAVEYATDRLSIFFNDLEDQSLKSLELQIQGVESAIEQLSDDTSALTLLRSALGGLVLTGTLGLVQFQNRAEAVEELRAQLEKLIAARDALLNPPSAKDDGLSDLEFAQLEKDFNQLRETLDDNFAASEQLRKSLALIGTAVKEGVPGAAEVRDLLVQLATRRFLDATTDTDDEAERERERLEQLRERFRQRDEDLKRQNRFLLERIRLTGQNEAAVQSLNIEEAVQNELLRRQRELKLPLGDTDALEQEIALQIILNDIYNERNEILGKVERTRLKTLEDRIEQVDQLVNSAFENLQSGLADSLVSVFDKGIDSAKDFEETMKDVAKRVAAEFAVLSLLDPEAAGAGLQRLLDGKGNINAPSLFNNFFGQRQELQTLEQIKEGLDPRIKDEEMRMAVAREILANQQLAETKQQTSVLVAGFTDLASAFASFAAGAGVASLIGFGPEGTIGAGAGSAVGGIIGSIFGIGPVGQLLGGLVGGGTGELIGLVRNEVADASKRGFRDAGLSPFSFKDNRSPNDFERGAAGAGQGATSGAVIGAIIGATLGPIGILGGAALGSAFGAFIGALAGSTGTGIGGLGRPRGVTRVRLEDVLGEGALGLDTNVTEIIKARGIGDKIRERVARAFSTFDTAIAEYLNEAEIEVVREALLARGRFSFSKDIEEIGEGIRNKLLGRFRTIASTLEGDQILEGFFFRGSQERQRRQLAQRVAEFFEAREEFYLTIREISGEIISEFEEKVNQLKTAFLEAAAQAEELGFSVAKLEKAFDLGVKRLRILGLEDLQSDALDVLGRDVERDLIRAYRDGEARLAQARILEAETGFEAVALALQTNTANYLDILNEATRPIQELLTDLTATSASPLPLRDVLIEAEARFQDLFAQVTSGDLSVQDDFVDAARALIDVSRDAFGDTENFFTRFNLITSALEEATGTADAFLQQTLDQLDINIDMSQLESLTIETNSTLRAQTTELSLKIQELIAEVQLLQAQQDQTTGPVGVV